MAGGMDSKDRGLGTLAERIAATKAAEEARAAAPAASMRADHTIAGDHGKRSGTWPNPQPDPGPAKHCWYDGPHGRQAALLLAWSQGGKVERRGLIAVAHLEPDGHWAIIEMWVEQGLLSPA